MNAGPSRLLARPRLGPALGALTFWLLSLWPTLLPRAAVMQGLVSGVSAALGWMLGSAASALVRWGLRRSGHRLPAGFGRTAWRALVGAGAVAVVVLLGLWRGWQNEQRAVMGMDGLGLLAAVPAVLWSLAVLAVLVLVGRLAAKFIRFLDRQASRVVRPAWGRVGVAAALIVIVVVLANVGRNGFVSWADSSFGLVNEGTPDGVGAPASSATSGGPESLVDWDTLGYQGRAFTGGVSSADDLAAFAGSADGIVEPIRVYVGLDSASTEEERVALALDELDRTGAFDRQVLVVATATGTGWINPDAARTLEFMYGGDTAIVSLQYSFFPSWVAFLVDTAGASDAGAALFTAVHARWEALPAQDRPRLIVFGESLGSFGAEAPFDHGDAAASFTALVGQADGALLVGPTAGNPIYGDLVSGRDPGSPTWRPELAAVPELRVANDEGEIDPRAAGWDTPRVLYLHHPTDAVGTWSPATLWRPPGWTGEPHGVGIVGATTWFPIVTWVQETADLMAGFSAVPGFGHDYRNELTAAWAAVVPPAGWTGAETERLQAFLELG